MSHRKFWQGWEQIAFGIVGAVALYCLLVVVISYWEMDGLNSRTVEEGITAQGTLKYLPMKGRGMPDIGVRDAEGSQWRCSIAYCSYEGIGQDYGKVVEIVVLEGQIVQIKVGGEIKLAKRDWDAAHMRSDFAVAALALCLVLFLMWFLGNRSKMKKRASALPL